MQEIRVWSLAQEDSPGEEKQNNKSKVFLLHTPVFLPGKSHGQRVLALDSPWGSPRVGYEWATNTILDRRWKLGLPCVPGAGLNFDSHSRSHFSGQRTVVTGKRFQWTMKRGFVTESLHQQYGLFREWWAPRSAAMHEGSRQPPSKMLCREDTDMPGSFQGCGVASEGSEAPILLCLLCCWLLVVYLICAFAKSLQSCPTLCDSMDHSLPGSSVHGVHQARILEWAAMPSSRGSSWPGI